jgi:hypothetical protein
MYRVSAMAKVIPTFDGTESIKEFSDRFFERRDRALRGTA